MEYNGRVDVKNGQNYRQYALFQEDKVDTHSMNRAAIQPIHINNPISSLFFSEENVNAIQEAIRYQVYMRSEGKHVIDKQSETELFVIMRAMYLQNARHKQYDLYGQIQDLNKLVLDYCVPRILVEIDQYMFYKNDISKLPVPLERGQLSSTKGSKVLFTREF